MVVIVATPQESVRVAMRWNENVRQKALVVVAFVELVNAVDAAHSGQVAKCDFVGSDSDDGAIFLEQLLDSSTLLQANNVGGDP